MKKKKKNHGKRKKKTPAQAKAKREAEKLKIYKRVRARGDNSIGEAVVETFLILNKYNYRKEYPLYINNVKFRPDFAILDKNKNVVGFIEFDGIQHFEPVEDFGGEEEFVRTQKRDSIKNQYCEDNNIKMLRIPHGTSSNKIEKLVNNWFSKKENKKKNKYSGKNNNWREHIKVIDLDLKFGIKITEQELFKLFKSGNLKTLSSNKSSIYFERIEPVVNKKGLQAIRFVTNNKCYDVKMSIRK